MNQFFGTVRKFIADRFSLHEDSAHDSEIIESIRRNVEFKGSNLWSLIFAIFIASIGLNVNSTAVIIGAMLVSPLMGPIMGIGLGMGINDVELIRRALKNLLIAVIISVAVSAFYFFLTPLHEAQSELLARTTPSIWDVFIAFFGGLAGIVGGTRKEKSNVIPGVAIATALMPPLCTAGFGLAIGNWYYFLGAFYLFFINSVFICISSYLIVRYMKLPKKAFEDKGREKRVMRYILTVVILTALPSVYLAYKIVDKSIFESNANRFVKTEFKFPKTHIINKTFRYEKGKKVIDLLLIGEDLSKENVDSLNAKLVKYNIRDTKLSISQGLNAKQQIDFSQIKASILEDVFAKQAANKNQTDTGQDLTTIQFPDIRNELKALYPAINSYSISRAQIKNIDTVHIDTAILFIGNFQKAIPKSEQSKLKSWLKTRMNIKGDSLIVIIQRM
jgi:uncharacterized hydrophobic protein (TIGR00271 family)